MTPLPDDVDRVPQKTRRDHVFDRLFASIADGTLKPGETLNDAAVAEQLGVSRTPVREALQRLQHYGLVETEPGRVTRIASAIPDDAELIYLPLAALHVVAAETAVPELQPADYTTLREANDALLRAVEAGDLAAAREADVAFHRVFPAIADNRYLALALDTLDVHFRRLELLYFADHGPALESYEEHERIIEAAEAEDVSLVVKLVRANLMRGLGRARHRPATP